MIAELILHQVTYQDFCKVQDYISHEALAEDKQPMLKIKRIGSITIGNAESPPKSYSEVVIALNPVLLRISPRSVRKAFSGLINLIQ